MAKKDDGVATNAPKGAGQVKSKSVEAGAEARAAQPELGTQIGHGPHIPDAIEDLGQFASNYAKVMARTQELWQKFLEANAGKSAPSTIDPMNITPVFVELTRAMLDNPKVMAERSMELWMNQAELARRVWMRMLGQEVAPLVDAGRDKRFADEEWSQNAVFDAIKQSYLLTSRWMTETVHNVGDIDPRMRKRADFLTRQFVEAMSPSNFAATNPLVLRATLETKGENLVKGLENLLRDLERGKGDLLISQTDMNAFKLGKDLGITPGKVVFQNNIMQLIQYAPTTEQVHETPLVIVPPWINKFYILDLTPKKSLIKWMVDQGYTVFVVSWVNPDERQAHETFESYIRKGLFTAVDKACEETGVASVHVCAYCIGGTMTGTGLALAAAENRHNITSATFLTTQLDFTDAGELQVFVDDHQLRALEDKMQDGYLHAENMAMAFNSLRASDLIWSYVVSNYMLGKEPMPFDLLYWNADSTAMPAQVHRFYLANYYKDNLLALRQMEMGGHVLDLSKVTIPVYHVATREDHIAPAHSAYRGARLFGSKVNRFVYGGSGHIAGIVNPPDAKKYQYWTNPDLSAPDLEGWLKGATEHPGSWWIDWDRWLAAQSGAMVPARVPGARLGVIEDAPGSYVMKRFDAPKS